MRNHTSHVVDALINELPLNYSKCVPIQSVFEDPVDSVWMQTGFGIMYSIVLLFGFAANVLTLYCLTMMPCHFGLNTKFLISLTSADLLMGITSLPITALQIFTRRWIFGGVFCRYVPLLQGTCFFVTSFTLVAIAVERYLNITRVTRVCRNHAMIVVCIWFVGILASMPYAWYMELDENCIEGMGKRVCMCGYFCDENWPMDEAKMAYGTSAFLIHFGVPLCVLTFCYCKVRRTVQRSVKRRMVNERLSLNSQRKLHQRKKRTSFVTMLLLMCFLVPWLPVSSLNLMRDYKVLSEEWHVPTLFAFVHLIAMTSILLNPIIYCLYNQEFLDSFKHALFCKISSDSLSSSRNNETYNADEQAEILGHNN